MLETLIERRLLPVKKASESQKGFNRRDCGKLNI